MFKLLHVADFSGFYRFEEAFTNGLDHSIYQIPLS
jgi:hypothetical protein